jgi:hypothetical protein
MPQGGTVSPSSSESTTLAEAVINGADELLVQLIQLDDLPAVVRITWPAKPSIIPPSRFNAVAAEAARLFASASTKLNQLRAQR